MTSKATGKSILTILDEHGVRYHKNGAYYVAYCVKHNDLRTPNMVIFPDTNSFFCFTCKFGSKPEHLVQHLDQCSRQEALDKVYGPDYIAERLEEDIHVEESRYPLRLVLSKVIRDELHKRNIPNLLTHLRWLDTIELRSDNLKEVIETIKGWT